MQHVPLDKVGECKEALLRHYEDFHGEICHRIDETGVLTDSDKAEIIDISRSFLRNW